MELLLLAASTFVSEDLACIGAGALIARGQLGWLPGIAACYLGIFFGDIWLFVMGRWIGRPALAFWPLKKMVKEDAIHRATDLFQRQGPSIVFASRFLPGTRLPVYFAAGLLRTGFWSFTGYFALACAIWTPLLVGLSAALQQQVRTFFEGLNAYSIILPASILYGLMRMIRASATYKNRRLLLSAWRRWTRWEFWPLWLFYPPVVLYILYLGIRFRSLTLFASANPAMPGGGFAGESKSEILQGLSGAGDLVARHFTIEARDGTGTALRGMADNGWTYPVVIKPDRGERGFGVCVIRSDEELRQCLADASGRMIVQEYVPGSEFGVFYVRYPDQACGSIFAITDKQFPSVTGDGIRTLAQLILSDDRAVCMAPFHLRQHSRNLERVVPAGERVQLVELGTHCRGALFLEGIQYCTPALERKIDEISRGYSGFFFGRYDIRTTSVQDFMQGQNFKIVELNGVTSEATSIYDPSYTVFHAYRVLMKQWRIAFEIGAANRKRGVGRTGVFALLNAAKNRRKESHEPTTNPMRTISKEEPYELNAKTAHS